jgi:REP element-mobilizing transposase RayT
MLHYIWATKDRAPIITPELKGILLPHIKANCKQKGIYLDSVNCVEDHIHLLVALDAEQTIAKVVQLIKDESSYWINNTKILQEKFAWQDDYIALSVSGSVEDKVRAYIANQEEHHKHKTFESEYAAFSKL